ncbi:MAG: DUF839 domain-containing protein [Planctomycetes bacterium]|nr:DUF839 domain-containing protein [Planctomycetota bacterium]
MNKLTILSTLVAASSLAAQNPFPLPASAGSTTATENTAPFVTPLRMTQTLITNRTTLLGQGLAPTLNNWDMVAFDPSSRFIFVPCENFAQGAGLFRYDTQTGAFATLLLGNGTGNAGRTANPAGWNPATDEITSMDPATWTPWGSVICGEETTGGRMFEVLNPLAPTGPFQVRWLTSIPGVSHEGMRFDANGALYFIDEENSGSIYKFVPTVAGNLTAGQTFVLSVDAYAASPNAVPGEAWNSTSNRLTSRTGPATWVPMTDANGVALTTANPFVWVTSTGGRTAADELVGTPFGRPEDLDIKTLANGRQAVFVATTSENTVYSIELVSSTSAIVRTFVNFNSINLYTGTDVNPLQNDPYTSPGSGTVLQNPDNIAIDAFGSVYVIEDSNPGDVWKCVDANNDGVAEGLGLFITLGVGGSEPTGMIFDPNDPYRFICCIQHPTTGNDALWSFTTRPYAGSNGDLTLKIGVDAAPTTGPGEFVKAAFALDVVEFATSSPLHNLGGRPFALLLQPVSTASGTAPFLPPLWMSPFLPIIPLVGGPAGQFTAVLPWSGSSVAVQVPAFLGGISVIAQSLAVAANGQLVCSDAHEIVLR